MRNDLGGHPATEPDSGHVAEPVRSFLQDVVDGLALSPAQLSPKYFYDEAGSRLFDHICELPEYYPTRTEMSILERSGPAIAARLGRDTLVIEPGSGSSTKVGLLLEHLEAPAGYVPVEISGEHMHTSLAPLRERFRQLPIHPVCADFTEPFGVPAGVPGHSGAVIFFPGSTIGNFPPDDAVHLLGRFRRLLDEHGGLLLGVDRRKDPEVLKAAYNDAAGVTAEFNLNLLRRMQRELDAVLDPDGFRHRAVWNDTESRIEMHLVSQGRQSITVGGREFRFHDGDPIVTEYSYKYSDNGIRDVAARAGFEITDGWTDERCWFSVLYLTPATG